MWKVGLVFVIVCLNLVATDLINMQYEHVVELERRVTLAWTLELPTRELREGETERERDEREGLIHMRVRALTRGWVAVAFSKKGEMIDSDAIMGFYSDDGSQVVVDTFLAAKKAACPGACPDNLQGGTADLISFNTTQDNEKDVTTVYFTRRLSSIDPLDRNISLNGYNWVLYSFSSNHKDEAAYHSVTNRGTVRIDFTTGSIKHHSDKAVLVTHGVIMFAVWNVITPISVMFMRYFTPKKIAMRIHLALQNIVVAGSLSLTFLALVYTTTHFNSAHSILGFVFLILCSIQGYIGNSIIFVFPPPFLKCSKGRKQYRFPLIIRKFSAFVHPYLGRILFILSFACVWTGMYMFSDYGWFHAIFWAWGGVILCFFVVLEVFKRYLKRLKRRAKEVQMDEKPPVTSINAFIESDSSSSSEPSSPSFSPLTTSSPPSSPSSSAALAPERQSSSSRIKGIIYHRTNEIIMLFAVLTLGILVSGAVGIVYEAFLSKGKLPFIPEIFNSSFPTLSP